MKKLLLTVSVICATMFANAASINWGADNQQIPGWPFNTPENQPPTVYLLQGSNAGVEAAVENGTFSTAFASAMIGGSRVANPAGGLSGLRVDGLPGVETSFFLVVFSADGKTYTFTDTVQITPADMPPGPLPNMNTWTFSAWKPVPEPATMALLGIGIVAVGLRRRRK